MANQVQVKLTGWVGKSKATAQNCSNVALYLGDTPSTKGYFQVEVLDSRRQVRLITPHNQGTFKMRPSSSTANTTTIYDGKINGISIQINLKKMVGTLIYWP